MVIGLRVASEVLVVTTDAETVEISMETIGGRRYQMG